MLERLKNEPAIVIGAIAAAILAAVQVLAGHNLIGQNIVDFLTAALNPDGGWLIPIVLGIVTRFFVYGPKTVQAMTDAAATNSMSADTVASRIGG